MNEQLASHRTSKLFVVYVVVVLLGIAAVWVLYECFAHQLVTAMYEGRSIRALNRLIQYQHKHSLDHYLELADTIFYRAFFLFSAGLGLIHILHRLIFSGKKIKAIWPILWGVFVLTGIYALNPNRRVYSVHGFMHAGIVYQIVHGNIPPDDPMLGDVALLYPWGYHLLTAFIVKVLNISPFYCFAIINVVSLGVCLILLYKISRLLIKDEKANIFSAITSIFGITFLTRKLIAKLSLLLQITAETRVTPVFTKFTNVNGLPIGLAFFLLVLYSLMKISKNKEVPLYTVCLFISILSCGFFYPQMLPGIVASGTLLCLVGILPTRYNKKLGLKRIGLIASVLAVSTLLLMPYLRSIMGEGGLNKIVLFNSTLMWENARTLLLLAGPVLVVIFISRKFLLSRLSVQPVTVLLITILGTAGCYIFIHMQRSNEYKFLILLTVMAGILGGIALYAMKQHFHKSFVLILLLLFLLPSYNVIVGKLKAQMHYPRTYVEKGRDIRLTADEGNELYQWIREHTAKDSVFIDSELKIPVFAQRQLFLTIDKQVHGKPVIERGYGLLTDTILREVSAYPPCILDERNRIVTAVYDPKQNFSSGEMEEFLSTNRHIYIVVRTEKLRGKFTNKRFDIIFESHDGHIIVYRPKP